MPKLLFCILLFIALGFTSACDSHRSFSSLPKSSVVQSKDLLGKWQVESIFQGGIIDYSMITVHIHSEGRISGLTGCNTYTGKVQSQDQQFLVTNVAVTVKACATAVSIQEQRFLRALNSAVSYNKAEHQWLYVLDVNSQRILKLMPMHTSK